LELAVHDFVAALSALNRALYGDVPSESVQQVDSVPLAAAYAVSEASRMLRDYRDSAEGALRTNAAASSIEMAWNAVLCGDIDDIEQHVRDEARARG
jgi:hypothetical protein